MKKLLTTLLALVPWLAQAQFTPGQVLTAQELNTAFAAKTSNIGAAIQSGTIDNTIIGSIVPAAGNFTTLNLTNAFNVPSLGATTPGVGFFTNLTATPTSGTAFNASAVAGSDVATFSINENNTRGIDVVNTSTGSSAGSQIYLSATPGSVTNAGAVVVNQYGAALNAYSAPLSLQASGNNLISLNTNGVARALVSGMGNFTINAPTSGTALNVAGVNTASAPYPVSIVGSMNATPGPGSAVLLQAYQAAFAVINAASNQNWYFGVNDASSNQLQIGRGYGAAQGVAPNITIATTGSITALSPSAGQTMLVQPGNGSNNSLSVYAGTANLALDIVGSTNTNNPSSLRFLNNAYSAAYAQIYSDASQFLVQASTGIPLNFGIGATTPLSISSSGLSTFSAPTSGTTLTVNGAVGSYAETVQGGNSAASSGVLIQGNYSGAGSGYDLVLADSNNSNGVSLLMSGNGATTPNKILRVQNGNFTVINNAGSSNVLTLTDAGGLSVAGSIGYTNILFSATAPTIASGFGTSPSIASSNGTATFRINVGTGGSATGGVLTMPAAAAGWNCEFRAFNPSATNLLSQTVETASTTTSVTLANDLTSTGAATAWPASTVLMAQCVAY